MSDQAVSGDDVREPYRPWEGDYTDLVHVLWDARRRGLSLVRDTDELANMLMQSRWLEAREARAARTGTTVEGKRLDGGAGT